MFNIEPVKVLIGTAAVPLADVVFVNQRESGIAKLDGSNDWEAVGVVVPARIMDKLELSPGKPM